MKKNNISGFFAALVMGSALFAASCEKPSEETPAPEFPQLIEKTVTPGESVTIPVQANLDWEISVPENGLQWFWIQDGAFQLYRLSGKAGEAEVVIGVSSTEEFDNDRVCEVTMKMGGESKVIARLVRPSKEKHLTVYAAVVVDGEVQFNETGDSYLYETEEAESLDMIWTGSEFRLPIKVESNYNWSIKTPEWARVDVPSDGVGEKNLIVYGVPSAYPLDAASGKLQFMSGEKVVKEYVVNIPGCKDIFSYKMDMSITELEFNYQGQIKVATGFIDGPASGYVSGADGIRVIALSRNESGFSTDAPSWLEVNVAEYDRTEGADVLQQRNFTVSAALNEGDNRHAALLFLPPTLTAPASDLFEGTEIKEEYKQYSVPVTQLSSDQEFISMLANPSDMAAGGATFAVSENEDLYSRFGQTRYAYELVYTNQYARDNARMIFTSAVTSYKVFDENGFLSMTLDEDMKGGVVDMVSETAQTGHVVLYGTEGNVLAVIECRFDPEEIIGEVADVAFIGESVMYAPMVGATLEDVSEDPSFSQYREGQALVYHLRYTMPAMPMTISIPSSIKKHTVNPYTFRHNIRVNDLKYDEDFVNGVLGGVALVDGGVTIYMEMPEGRDYLRGNIIFSNSADETILVLVCTLDLRETAE
ncbi:MAG: BACON domain-containing protein [Bacteroidales bacterium]|nr:BACON domain-containing protein [Bacteroidales bacterium]